MLVSHPTHRRGGFTLVELIVVITIILLITALGAALLPRFLDNQYQTRAVDQLSQWLLTAKQRAKRDGRATGLRLLVDPNTLLCNQLQYVQQPDPYTAGKCSGVDTNTGSIQFQGVDFQGAAPQPGFASETFGQLGVILAGDYLELNGGGAPYIITGVSTSQGLTSLTLFNTGVGPTPTLNYRIIRQPRPLIGEDILTLPQDMVVNLNLANPSDKTSGLSKNVSSRSITGGNPLLTVYEILFSPTGAVIGQNVPSGKIILWVCNTTDPNGPVMNPNGPPPTGFNPATSSLVNIQIRTGFIAAHSISLSGDYYLFTEDGRSSGM